MLWIMAGNWKNDGCGKENNFARNSRASIGASRLLDSYDGEICFLGYEIGDTVMTRPKSGVLLDVFRDHNSAEGRSSWDPLLTVLAAECPDFTDEQIESAGYSIVRGNAGISALTGENTFKQTKNGKHRYVKKLYDDTLYEDKLELYLHE